MSSRGRYTVCQVGNNIQGAKRSSLTVLLDMRLRIIIPDTNTPQVMFQPFEMRELVDKVAGSAILARTLLLQTRLLVMLQVNTHHVNRNV